MLFVNAFIILFSFSVLDKTIESIKSFHEQPQEVKAKHYVRSEQSGVMYASNNDLFRSKAASWHDFVHVWMSPEPANVDQIPAACRSEIVAWDKEATRVAEMVTELLSEGLGVGATKLKEAGLLVTKTIAGVYYPSCPQPDMTLGLNHHTDPGVLTVLLENQVVGLQVKHEGEWVDVKPVPGSLIINIGDALQVMQVVLIRVKICTYVYSTYPNKNVYCSLSQIFTQKI